MQRRSEGAEASEKGVVRVKVILTKAEVAKLLSVGVNNKADIIQHLAIEVGRFSFGTTSSWKPTLQTIPESYVHGHL